MTALDFFSRWRVRLGYLLAVVVLLLARPTPRSILLGAAVGVIGLAMRAYAAGYLHKQEVLTTTGPYAYTRNPLYFGSSILAVGAAVAMRSWVAVAVILFYFVVVYTLVMRREEMELRAKHGAAFDAYAAAVPLFFPRLTPRSQPGAASGTFSWAQYERNHEHEAPVGFLLFLILLVVLWRWRAL
ncbi:MAG TPA: methyltransferase [Verrucomicrobiae bacterium]|nr:methyltransferase [Verrucomicrobiae bacterium]